MTGLIGFLGADWWGSDARATAMELRRRGGLLIERHYEDFFPTRWRATRLRLVRRLLRSWMQIDYNSAVQDLLAVDGLQFLLVFKGMLLLPQTLQKFRDRNVPIYCLYPDVSFQDHGGNIWDCLPLYDCVFTTKPYHLNDKRLKERTRRLVAVEHGFDAEVHRPVQVTDSLLRQYGCDVSFVGAWSAKKERMIRWLLQSGHALQIRIWGPSWNRAAADVRSVWQGRGAWGDETTAIYACSRINLGLLSEAGTGTVSGDLTTARTWQIPASGGFMLHEDTAELRQSFAAETEVGLFQGESDLAERVLYWLQHDEARRTAAARAMQKSLQVPYTYARAVAAILQFHQQGRSVD